MITKSLHPPVAAMAFAAALLASAAIPALAADQHMMTTPDKLVWVPAPPIFPKGQEVTVIVGDPSKPEPFVLRARVPAGYEVAPHSHPTDESVTVLSGRIHVSMSPTPDKSKGMALGPGGFFFAPKGMAHYVWFTEPTVIQVHGVGPLGVTYINPKDDPTKSN